MEYQALIFHKKIIMKAALGAKSSAQKGTLSTFHEKINFNLIN